MPGYSAAGIISSLLPVHGADRPKSTAVKRAVFSVNVFGEPWGDRMDWWTRWDSNIKATLIISKLLNPR
jgi:hypothetical protein